MRDQHEMLNNPDRETEEERSQRIKGKQIAHESPVNEPRHNGSHERHESRERLKPTTMVIPEIKENGRGMEIPSQPVDVRVNSLKETRQVGLTNEKERRSPEEEMRSTLEVAPLGTEREVEDSPLLKRKRLIV